MFCQITKDFKFEAAHRLMFHKGGCKNIHGHSYKVIVGLYGEPNKETGMVLDYGDLKEIVEKGILQYDHAILLNKEDVKVVEFVTEENLTFVLFDGEPTAENIAVDILKSLKDMVNNSTHILGATIRVKESATTSAEVNYAKGE